MTDCPNCHIPNPTLYIVDGWKLYCKNCNEDFFPIFKAAIDEAIEKFQYERKNKIGRLS